MAWLLCHAANVLPARAADPPAVDTAVRVVAPQGRGGVGWAVALRSDSRFALTGGTEGVVILWETATQREVRRFRGHVGKVEAIQFSPDNKTAFTGGQDGIIRQWELATGREVRRFVGHTNWVTALDVSADGKQLVSGGNDLTARLWNVADSSQLWALEELGFVSAVRFSPNGRQILTAGGMRRLNLWDTETGSQIREFPRHESGINTADFSPDGRFVLSGEGYFAAQNGLSQRPASAPADCLVRVYETATGREVRGLVGHQAAVLSARFDQSNRIVSAGDDGAVRVWDAEPARP